jgi:hypothetical protein
LFWPLKPPSSNARVSALLFDDAIEVRISEMKILRASILFSFMGLGASGSGLYSAFSGIRP